MRNTFILALVVLLTACSGPAATKPVLPSATPIQATQPASTPLPPVEGPDPSYKVAAFYYGWYGNVSLDPEWYHWDDPQELSADYYPQLGPYSSNDPLVVAQHMAWLRKAGIGVIVVSWWGRGGYEERPFLLIMEMAERYGIKVAFHIEPYPGRTADGLVSSVEYLYQTYGDLPAFFRTTASSRYSPGEQPKGLFFVWCIESADCREPGVEADYWQAAMDEIHALPESPLVIANTTQGNWITEGHFDGLYNYNTLHLEQQGGFSWARSLPPDSLYVPSVIPGYSAQRIGDPPETLVLREEGKTFNDQWTAALGAGVQPDMVTITSFNEWHEGTMIEPPAIGAADGFGNPYLDFGGLPPDGYLTLTRQWIEEYLEASLAAPATYRVRVQIKTTSDWTTLHIISGGVWMRPEPISASETVVQAGFDSSGDGFALIQSLSDANAGKEVEMTWDVLMTGLDAAQDLVLNIDRGGIGRTQVTIFNYTGSVPVEVQTFTWSGVTTDRNSHGIEIPSDTLMNPQP